MTVSPDVSMMPFAHAPSDLASLADRALTSDRHETKYVVEMNRILPLLREVSLRLRPHQHGPDAQNCVPEPHHFITTVYFDTESRQHYRNARSNPLDNVKLRVKEYYDAHPSLASPAQPTERQSWLWFELKRRTQTRTTKQRFALRKRDVFRFLSCLRIGSHPPALELRGDGLQEILDYCKGLSEPLGPSCVVNYQRLAWQDAGSALRVTLDSDVAFYAPPRDLWTSEQSLTKDRLGQARDREALAILEIKHRSAVPPWLHAALASAGARSIAFSKFVRAASAVDEKL
jgi:hypothetical protein